MALKLGLGLLKKCFNNLNSLVNSHTMMSNSNKSESSNVPALSLLHRDYTTNAHSSPPTYESNQSIANIDSTATTTNTPNTTTGTISSNTQQQHEDNLKRLKIRIKNRQQSNKTQSNSNRHHFRRFKSTSAHDNDDLYEEYNNRVNKNDDDLLLGDEDDDLEDDDDDDSANLANNDTTANTTTTTNTSNSSSKKNPNSHVFKKIFTRAHYTQFGDPNDYYQDADDYYGNHANSANIRIEPISLVNIKSNANNSKRATNFVNIERISTSTSSSTTGSANEQKQQIKIPIKIINTSNKQQPLIKSPIINFANQKQQQQQKKQPVIDYTTFDSLADTTANVSVSSRSRCTVINSKATKQQQQSPEQPQVKLKIIPLKRSNTSDLLSNNNQTPINTSKRSNQYYPQQTQFIHCNTCSCCQCPARKQQCYVNNTQQAPLVMNIKDSRFSSVNKSSKFKFQHSEAGSSNEHQNLTKSSTANQLPINKYNHTTYHYKTNYNSSTTPSNNSSTATNKKERKATEQITKSKQQQQQRYLDEQGRFYNKNFIFNTISSTTTTNKHNQHFDELSLLENLDEELDREIAKTIKSKSGKKSTNIKMSKCNMDSDCMDYSKLINSEEDLLATEIGLTLNSLRRPHSAFQIDSYPMLNDDMLDMEDDDEEDEDESGTGVAVAEDEQDSDSNLSHFKVNYNTSNYTPTYDLPKSVINKQNQYQRKNKEPEHYYDSQNVYLFY